MNINDDTYDWTPDSPNINPFKAWVNTQALKALGENLNGSNANDTTINLATIAIGPKAGGFGGITGNPLSNIIRFSDRRLVRIV